MSYNSITLAWDNPTITGSAPFDNTTVESEAIVFWADRVRQTFGETPLFNTCTIMMYEQDRAADVPPFFGLAPGSSFNIGAWASNTAFEQSTSASLVAYTEAVSPVSLSVDILSLYYSPGDVVQFRAFVTWSDGRVIPVTSDAATTWESSDLGVVGASNVFVAGDASVTITARNSGLFGSITVYLPSLAQANVFSLAPSLRFVQGNTPTLDAYPMWTNTFVATTPSVNGHARFSYNAALQEWGIYSTTEQQMWDDAAYQNSLTPNDPLTPLPECYITNGYGGTTYETGDLSWNQVQGFTDTELTGTATSNSTAGASINYYVQQIVVDSNGSKYGKFCGSGDRVANVIARFGVAIDFTAVTSVDAVILNPTEITEHVNSLPFRVVTTRNVLVYAGWITIGTTQGPNNVAFRFNTPDGPIYSRAFDVQRLV